jgi:hypothetical protein
MATEQHNPESAAPAYLAPEVTVLGTLAELTNGIAGGPGDNDGNGPNLS